MKRPFLACSAPFFTGGGIRSHTDLPLRITVIEIDWMNNSNETSRTDREWGLFLLFLHVSTHPYFRYKGREREGGGMEVTYVDRSGPLFFLTILSIVLMTLLLSLHLLSPFQVASFFRRCRRIYNLCLYFNLEIRRF